MTGDIHDSAEPTHAGFYRALQDKFRGSRELILSRLRVYLPFVTPLMQIYPGASTIDLGCGRGEWLDLLGDCGFQARGVDLDDNMLAACRERGLDAHQGEAVGFLRGLPDESQAVVSGFHIAEHLPFVELQQLVKQALRVLKPSGLLILETPNPENIRVSSLSFFLDPTHVAPLPPALLSFLPEYYGFARTKVLRLNEAPGVLEAKEASLELVLGGVSPDYAIVAQKRSEPTNVAALDEAFSEEWGVAATVLIERFDQRIARQTERLMALSLPIPDPAGVAATIGIERQSEGQPEVEVARGALLAEQVARETAERQLQSERDLRSTVEQQLGAERRFRALVELQLAAERGVMAGLRSQLAAVRAARVAREGQIAALLASRSWRMTAPLRAASNTTRWLANGAVAWATFRPGSRPRRVARASAVSLVHFVLPRPALARPAKQLARRIPALDRRLRAMLALPSPGLLPGSLPEKPDDLSPWAKEIHRRLKQAIAEQRRD